jgi:hypothetical protein
MTLMTLRLIIDVCARVNGGNGRKRHMRHSANFHRLRDMSESDESSRNPANPRPFLLRIGMVFRASSLCEAAHGLDVLAGLFRGRLGDDPATMWPFSIEIMKGDDANTLQAIAATSMGGTSKP